MSRRALMLLAILLAPAPLGAQDWGLTSPPQRAEFGYFRQDHRRTFEDGLGAQREISWSRQGAFVAVPLARTLAVELNGLAWYEGATDAFPGRDYFKYAVGMGATWLPFDAGHFRFGTSLFYHELGGIDRSATPTDIRIRELASTLGTSIHFGIGPHRVELWGGPGLEIEWLNEFPSTSANTEGKSVSNLGGAFGGNLLISKHVRIAGRFARFGSWEHQVSLAVTY